MADDRPVEGEVEAIARLSRELADLRSTVLVRVARRPTGSTEWTFASTPPAGTVLLQGQTVLRADYPALWQWAVDHGAVAAGRFGVGDGSTTFTLPNVSGRVLVGTGTLGADTYAAGATGGAAAKTLLTENLPAHDHGPVGSHSHPFTTGASGGNHGDHNSDYFNAAAGGVQLYTSATPFGNAAHVHSGTTDTQGAHTHASVGSGTPVDVRPPYLAVQWLIWT